MYIVKDLWLKSCCFKCGYLSGDPMGSADLRSGELLDEEKYLKVFGMYSTVESDQFTISDLFQLHIE